jgi:hypothetical protein
LFVGFARLLGSSPTFHGGPFIRGCSVANKSSPANYPLTLTPTPAAWCLVAEIDQSIYVDSARRPESHT